KKSHSDFWSVEYLSAQGVRVKTQLFVASLSAVRAEVAGRGGALIHAEPYHPSWWQKEYFSGEYRLAFLRGLRLHLQAGSSAGQALGLMVQTESNERIRAQLTGALDVL